MKKFWPLIFFIILGILILPLKTSKVEPIDETYESNEANTGIGLLEFRGVDFYSSPNSYDTKFAFEALENLLKIPEFNYIQIRFFLIQDSLKSSEVKPYGNQDHILSFLIQRIHQSGKKVSLMPQLLVTDKEYEANLKPQNKALWFASYSEALLYFAQLAETNKVELFSIGNEFTSMFLDGANDTEWNKMIDSVKEIYHGRVTVKLNCWYKQTQFDNLLKLSWFQKLDYLGVAAYFDLTDKMDPTEEDLKKAWFNSRQGINFVKELATLFESYQKPIIFSEIGYRNVDGCNIEPWNADSKVPRFPSGLGTGKKDDEEAILCAKVLFETFKAQSWWKGTFWFCWPTGILSENDTGYGIRGKPVLQEILNEYAGRG
jgi:hypothetical protein